MPISRAGGRPRRASGRDGIRTGKFLRLFFLECSSASREVMVEVMCGDGWLEWVDDRAADCVGKLERFRRPESKWQMDQMRVMSAGSGRERADAHAADRVGDFEES